MKEGSELVVLQNHYQNLFCS